MGKVNVSKVMKDVNTAVTKYSPEILTGIGVAGMVTTVIFAVRATPKALQLIEKRKEELEVEKLPGIEVVKATWKCYVPTVVSGVTSIACIIGASSVNARRNAALATAYKLSETAFTEYKDKVVETIGEKKEKVVKEKLAEDRVQKNPVGSTEVIITDKGNTLCYDSFSGRYFKSDLEKIKRAENEFNKQLLDQMYASLNDLYDYLYLDHTKIGDRIGWQVENGLLEMDFSSVIAEDGTPCIVIDYNIIPKYDFYNFA